MNSYSSYRSSKHDLARREKRLLTALEDFANTGPSKKDWLVLKRRQPGFLPDEVYELAFDKVIDLNRRYAEVPLDDESWAELPELLAHGVTFAPRREGPNQDRFVEFTLLPLVLQNEVRRLWRDPLIAADQILPTRFTVDYTGDYALRKALNLTCDDDEEEQRSGWWSYSRTGRITEELDDLRELMRSFILEINWTKGRLTAKFATDFQEACYYLVKNSDRAKFCGYDGCLSPYFIAKRAAQKYCGDGCIKQIQKQSKLRWWNRVGHTRRKRQKSRRLV